MSRLPIRVTGILLLLAALGGCVRSPEARRDNYLARGKTFLQKRDYSRAILEFRNAAEATPKDAEAYYQIGLAYEGSGDIGAAAACFKKALDRNPKHAGAQLKLAQIMAGATKTKWLKDAEARLVALKQDHPASPEILDTLALAELKLSETGQAVQNLQDSLAIAPAELKSSILLAQAKLEQHNPDAAEQVLRKASTAAPRSANPHIALGAFYVLEKMPGKAEAEFQRALALDPKSGPALLDLAKLQRSLGRTQEAEQSFRRLAASGEDIYKPVLAQFLFSEGRRDEAVREFERLANADPENAPARTRLVAAYELVGRTSDAQRVLDEALKKNPTNLDALLQRAGLSVRSGQYQSANTDLNQVLYLRPNSAEAHYLLARIEAARSEMRSYRDQLSQVLQLNPHLLSIRLELARNLLRDKQAGAALQLLDTAPAGQRELTRVIVQRNWALWALGDLAEMRKGIDQGLSHERSADLLIQDGLYQLKTGNASRARASLAAALEMNPADLRALAGINKSYVALKQPELALKAIQEYAAKEPKSAPVQEFLGAVLWTHGEHAQARAAFEAAKIANAQFLPADFSLAQIDAVEGKWDDAAARLRAVLSRNARVVTAHQWLGDIDCLKGSYNAAIQEYQQVVDITPNDPAALNNLAYLLLQYRQQSDAALKLAQKAVELAPDDPNFLDTLGWVLYAKGLYAPAIPYLERAASQAKNPVLQYHLAMAYAKAGAPDRAHRMLALALKTNPKAPEASLAISVVAKPN